jgi:type IV pilus assembly protein PilQ
MNTYKFLRGLYVSVFLFFFVTFSQADTAPQPVTFDFQTIQVSSALQLLADYRGLNLVLDDNVRGSLSMRMKNVTWDEAIEYVTSAKGLYIPLKVIFFV